MQTPAGGERENASRPDETEIDDARGGAPARAPPPRPQGETDENTSKEDGTTR